ncbi:glycosyltransferase family 2 protein [Natronococcus sp. A-GB1]|uniref:glycosyltransferase n=1 Tax=Natronococcus sp. A-GB1 TaxID=3037648 RepID=UPI00241EB69B|nr:glycosyltransferase family 2 protein [Natronococcus sp. A-GB1]MDG5761546.1 glycosyltransferase family 2 protein [Natronococcus sp. A-GB1]
MEVNPLLTVNIEPMDDIHDDIGLSVVVVTYNEEEHIADCLDSIFRYCEPYLSEVIVVDSNSTDSTTNIASNYPITLLQITEEQYASPSAGRYVGTQYAQEDYILFVDGDLTLSSEWLPLAFQQFNENSELGGISGHLNSISGDNSDSEVRYIKAVMLFKREALKEAGTFHPFLTGAEDYELSFRIKKLNYQLMKLPVIVAQHPKKDKIKEPVRRFSNNYVSGLGQTLRLHYKSKDYILFHFWRIKKRLLIFSFIISGFPTLIYRRAFRIWALAMFALFTIGGLIFGPVRFSSYVIITILYITSSAISFIKGVPDPDCFPLSEVIAERKLS